MCDKGGVSDKNKMISKPSDERKLYVDQYLLECGEEDLTEVQSNIYARNNELLEFAKALQSTIQNSTLNKDAAGAATIRVSTGSAVSPAVSNVASSSPMLISPQNGFQNGGFVVLDPNMKLMVGGQTVSTAVASPTQSTPRATIRIAGPQTTSASKVPHKYRAQTLNLQQKFANSPISTATAGSFTKPRQVAPVNTTAPLASSIPNRTFRPITSTAVATRTSAVVDLTDDDRSEVEVAPEELPAVVPGAAGTNKKDGTQEKTYPSLVVVARTSLSAKTFTQAVTNTERQVLDNKMKKVLQMNSAVFTEHLLQQRLLKCDQYCTEHPEKKLKLGMYSDSTKFPYSGGYVWIGDCCGGSFTSVFKGSIFEIGPHPPTVILKLLYHWSCQTSVSNVLQWVKVDNSFLKTFYMYLRASCVAAVHEKYEILGNNPKCKRLEVGVISLGTSTGAGGVKEVKVDILGVMDHENKKLRLRALDHLNMTDPNTKASEVYLKKFQRILETLQKWVNPKSTIVTDFAIDRNLCNRYGFTKMCQSNDSDLNNNHIMEYLRFVVPRMFQNTLNLLSRHIIQQFLDELVWRETWGQIPSRAYESMIEQLAEQTKLEGPQDMSVKYTLISSNPYKDWRYANWSKNMKYNKTKQSLVSLPNPISSSSSSSTKSVILKKKLQTNKKMTLPKLAPVSRPAKIPSPPPPLTSAEESVEYAEHAKIALEPYYYGSIPGDPSKQKPTGLFGAFLTECVLCSKDLYSSTAFTNHLVHHALNSNDAMAAGVMGNLRLTCKFCMAPVANLDVHVKDYHKHSHLTKKTMCKICNKILRDEKALISHMIYTHVELDMPYYCEICEFRTSIYQDMLTHFGRFHNKDTSVQCPFCLKVVRFSSRNGVDIPRNQLYFIQHVQKHTISKSVRKCEKCALSFTNLSTLKNHQEYFHLSCANSGNVERYDCNPNDFILMAAPLTDPPPPMALNDPENFTLKGMPLTPSIKIHPNLKFFLCAECDGPITPNHFCVRMTCTKCAFQTCCANAIKEHNATSHPVGSNILTRPNLIGGRPFSAKPLYCGYCLFSTSNGNRMATHMVTCDDGRAIAVSDKRRAAALSGETFAEELPPRKKKKNLPREDDLPDEGTIEDEFQKEGETETKALLEDKKTCCSPKRR
uniref:Pogo transposable element with ZNF domain n=1 Tax=Lygus hesperus TaxID=30085 RepID=A0A146LCN9_LYGHE